MRGLGPTLRVGGLGPQEHEAGGAVDVAAGLGVFDGHLEFAVGFAPGRGPTVQHDLDLGFAPLQLGAQQIAEQAVVPVPLAPPVERDEQEVRPFERLEHARGAGPVEHGIAQAAAHAVEHRRAREERDVVVGQPCEQFRAEVVGHQPVVAA